MSTPRLVVITTAMMLSLFLASIEQTIVATAMPTIVAQLGGLTIYAWVFTAFMLASTTMVPIFGKLADIFGRRPVYLVAMAIFLTGSVLCGLAQDMTQLIAFRAFQGLGAGGLMPIAFTIIGDLFSFEQRAKMQGLFSSVWGLSSIIGPLLGGLFVDSLGWQWVFWINLVPGLFATTLVLLAWRELHPPRGGSVDVVGALLLAGGIVTLLLALGQMNAQQGFDVMRFAPLLGVSLILFALLLVVERHVPNPILPLALFRQRLFASATGHGFLAGFALFGTVSFLPLAVKAVLGVSATQAGATLTPLMLGWVSASVVSSWLLLRIPYRRLVITGATALLVGATILFLSTSGTMSQTVLWICGALMGLGMGAAVSPFLITIQSTVGRQFLGAATATLQFSRTIGGTVGVGVMGMILAWRLAAGMDGLGMDPHTVALDALLDASTTASAATLIALREVLVNALQGVFLTALGAAVLAWVVCIFAPHIPVRVRQTVRSEPQIENVPAE